MKRAVTIIFAAACVVLPVALSAQVLDLGTAVNYAGPYPGGLTDTTDNVVEIVGNLNVSTGVITSGTAAVTIDDALQVNNGLQVFNGVQIFSGTGAPGENSIILNSTTAAIGSPSSGLVVNSAANTVQLVVGSGMTTRGVFISPTQTVLSGGTGGQTELFIDDNGVTLNDAITGDAVPLHGVANGVGAFDAVNVRQLTASENRLSGGVAAVAALAAIPDPVCCKNYSVGFGYGHYNGENAGAIGFKANIPRSFVTLGVGAGFGEDSPPAYNFGASIGF